MSTCIPKKKRKKTKRVESTYEYEIFLVLFGIKYILNKQFGGAFGSPIGNILK
jgi:hypothetical protein